MIIASYLSLPDFSSYMDVTSVENNIMNQQKKMMMIVGGVFAVFIIAIVAFQAIKYSHVSKMNEKEFKEFKLKYPDTINEDGKKISTPNIGSTSSRWIILFTVLPLVFLGAGYLAIDKFNLDAEYIAGIAGVILVGYYSFGMSKMMKSSQQDFIDVVNTSTEKTNLKVERSNISIRRYGYSNVRMENTISGKYKGKDASYSLKSSNVKNTITATIQTDSTLEFKLQEKKPNWSKFDGKDANDCFDQRFELMNIPAKQLPVKFKELTVSNYRNLNLLMEKGKLTFVFNGRNGKKGYPAYSQLGSILLIDLLYELSSSLK